MNVAEQITSGEVKKSENFFNEKERIILGNGSIVDRLQAMDDLREWMYKLDITKENFSKLLKVEEFFRHLALMGYAPAAEMQNIPAIILLYANDFWVASESFTEYFSEALSNLEDGGVPHRQEQEQSSLTFDVPIYYGYEDDQVIRDYPILKQERPNKESSYQYISQDLIGLFCSGELIKYAKRDKEVGISDFLSMEDLYNDPRVMPFASEEDRKNMIKILDRFYSSSMNGTLMFSYGIILSEMRLRDQIQLITFLSKSSNKFWDRVSDVVTKNREHSVEILEMFYATSVDSSLGESLLKVLEKKTWEEISPLFDEYRKTHEFLDTIERVSADFFYKKKHADKMINTKRVVENFIKRNVEILHRGLSDPIKGVELFKKFRADIVLFSSVFKSVIQDNPDIQLNEVAGLEVVVTNQHELSDREVEQMKSIVVRNWSERHDGLSALKSFNDFLEGHVKSTLYVLKREGEIVAFVRYDQMKDANGSYIEGEKYGASFNIDPAYKTSALGASLFHESMKRESEKNNITAIVDIDYSFTPHYIEDFGFIIVDVNLDESKKSGDFVMYFSKENKNKFLSRSEKVSIEDIVKGKTKFDMMHVSVSDELDETRILIAKKIKDGNVITHFIVDPKDATKRYVVFEKNYSLLNAIEPDLFKAAA